MQFFKNWDIKINYLHLPCFSNKNQILKSNMKKVLLTILTVAFATTIFAQGSLKLGHINSQELLQAMPESDSAQLKLEKASKELQDQLQAMQVELNNKYQDYLAKRDTYSELIKQTKESELQEMQQRIQQFQQTAEQDVQKQRADLFKPILDKANKAIADVAKDGNYTYILDITQGAVIYHAENSSDILALVKTKLGLDKTKAAPAVKK
jgi:outer membrane protein